jgi:YceI-like protein
MYAQLAKVKALFFLPVILSLTATAQVRYSSATIDLLISGTSTLHDWTMKSVKAQCIAVFQFNAAGQITGLEQLSFSTPANALKSEHSAMDNNAYKALKTNNDPLITYTLGAVTVSPAAGGASTVTCTGKLTIAGATRDAQLVAVCKPNTDNTVTVTGTNKISMKDFSIDPPTFMLGTIKTGNDITLAFTLTLKRS